MSETTLFYFYADNEDILRVTADNWDFATEDTSWEGYLEAPDGTKVRVYADFREVSGCWTVTVGRFGYGSPIPAWASETSGPTGQPNSTRLIIDAPRGTVLRFNDGHSLSPEASAVQAAEVTHDYADRDVAGSLPHDWLAHQTK